MFSLGKRSQRNLVGVHPYLGFFVNRLIERTNADFSVFEGLRSEAKQRSYIARGVSHTMDSYHLYGLAVDLVPWNGHRCIWDGTEAENMFNEILFKGHQVIKEYDLPIQNGYDLWGWDKPHWQMTGWKDKYDIRKLK